MNYSGVGNAPIALAKRSSTTMLIARQDRLPVWALPSSILWSIGIGFAATYFCISDINVPFIQTCVQIVPHCLPVTAGQYIGLPVIMSLLGYVIGTLTLSPLADRYGRRDVLFATLVIIALGSLYSALTNDYINFTISRAITGIGIGADLAIVTTYISETAPNAYRAKYISAVYFIGQVAIATAIWLGLYLSTPAAPLPLGLPFALAGENFAYGWRIIYLIGSFLAITGLFFRFHIPESPRWLIARGRLSQAELIIEKMEQRALAQIQTLPPVPAELPTLASKNLLRDIFGTNLYLKRTIILIVIWLVDETGGSTHSGGRAGGFPVAGAGADRRRVRRRSRRHPQ
jgi:MFS transporter, putative metabolite:H+ symporter